jgi:hypothetical protein
LVDPRIDEWLIRPPWPVAAAIALLVFVLVEIVRAKVRRWLVARRLRLQAGRALAAETWAARLLARAGYAVRGSQVRAAYDLWIDGRRLSIELRADYVVERRGRSFVAEVKSGQLAPSLETAATRRQLLEYSIAFAVDGVLLVDGESGTIHEVVFPAERQAPSTRSCQASLAPF